MVFTVPFVIILVLLFVVLFIFSRTIDKRIWVAFLISIVLTPMIYFYVLYPLINIFSDYHHEKHFEAKAWKKSPAFRYEMANELEQSDLLIGKSKTEVNTLLGEPEWFSWNDAIKANDSNFWNYNLGIKPGAFNKTQECIKIIFVDNIAESLEHYQLELKFDE
ncbi:hypothetical protein [Formosa algae]|uniref:Uncharacterized protein n=1 Tax=Formosa algae TaxID=225843 RepID=A0A9X1CC24_9FLAO|nr:hypothetical protein [Formosa algae]MBP1839719.1 hypothetical protein [Formosa algae]MDQ0335318.1 hypothetical protein [Formosa algae]OEI80061.1 hypothetical protein AST99_11310 [Formosa algae]PNW25945.1 hypothetical protein BKP44_18580 [Formosa algae]